MADTKLTGLTEQTILALDDWLYSVDKSETTDDAAGSSRKIAYSTLLQYVPHGLTEIAITDATTAPTIGRMHAYKATSADRTVVLPTAASQAGKIIGIRITTDTTKLFTFDGNSTETIDGALTRVMWAGESAVLQSDGANWFKIAGKSIPMTCRMKRTTSTGALNNDDYTTISLNATEYDSAGMADTGNGRINIVRKSQYMCGCVVQVDGSTGSGGMTYFGPSIYKNTSTEIIAVYQKSDHIVNTAMSTSSLNFLDVGDAVKLRVYKGGSGAYSLLVSNPNFLEVVEVPSW